MKMSAVLADSNIGKSCALAPREEIRCNGNVSATLLWNFFFTNLHTQTP